MNDLKEKIEKSKLIVTNIYDCIGRIESVAKTYECVEQGQVGILMPDGNMIDLNVLTDEQIVSIKKSIKEQLDAAITNDSAYLDMISARERKPSTINQDFEDAVEEMVHSVQSTTQDVNLQHSTSETEKVEEVDTNDEIELKIENTASTENERPWTNKDTLYKMYITEGMTALSIAEKYSVRKQDIANQLHKYGIKKDDFKPGKQNSSKKKVTPSKSN